MNLYYRTTASLGVGFLVSRRCTSALVLETYRYTAISPRVELDDPGGALLVHDSIAAFSAGERVLNLDLVQSAAI